MKKIVLYIGLISQISIYAQAPKSVLSPETSVKISAMEQGIDVTMFPKIEGMVKNVIFLDRLENEEDLKIEVYITKSESVDPCNRFSLVGTMDKKDVDGWGYSYYIFQTKGVTIGTKMACMNDSRILKDIASQDSRMLPYNSRIPFVFYTPEGYKVRYKTWKKDSKEGVATAY